MNLIWLDSMGWFEITVFIENIVGRQKRFMGLPNWFPSFKQCSRVMKWLATALVAIDEPDKQRSSTNAGMQLLKDLKCFRDET